jgi:hypothetical protein
MSKQNVFSTLIVTWVAVASLAILMCASPARAQNSAAEYTLLVGAGVLCDPGDSGKCPAVVKSANGESYHMSGAGLFKTQSNSVTAAGTYTHESPDGTVIESGIWIASQMVHFESYGIAPGALLVGGKTAGPLTLGAKPTGGPPLSDPQRFTKSIGLMPTGGLAVFRIHLMPMTGTTKTAVLEVNCALGNVPHERSVEGIRITLERNNFEYSEEASGRVIFLALRPEVSPPAKMPEQEARPEASEQPQK